MEIKLGLTLKQALIIKHGLENRMDSKKRYIEKLNNDGVNISRVEKLSNDLIEEERVLKLISNEIEYKRNELNSIKKREQEVKEYAEGLDNSLKQVYEAEGKVY